MEFIKEKERIYGTDGKGKVVAEITFPETEKGVFTITHTFVDESLRGQGIAGQLVQEAINAIRKKNGKVEATCSYAKAWLEKHKKL